MKSHKSVLVIGMNGIGLMPTTACKARKLLEAKKAKVYSKMPFTIKLLYKTGCAVQIGWITGFSGTNTAYLKNKEGKYITIQGKNYKNIPLSNVQILERNNTWITYTK